MQRRLNEKIHELERKNETLQNTIYELRQNVRRSIYLFSLIFQHFLLRHQITENDRDHHLKIAEFDDENQRLKLKHKEEIKDQQLTHQRELQRLKETVSFTEQNFKEQIHQLETIRTSLERVKTFLLLFSLSIVNKKIFSFERQKKGNEWIKIFTLNTKIES